ncbi:hypothetical protein WDW37_07660 [Bdellovibrionota bacterium FG-1]
MPSLKLTRRPTFFVTFFATFFVFVLALAQSAIAGAPGAGDDPDDYDRLDGTGKSGRKVHVIEWEGNLEVHVYPSGSLKGLALKLDKRNKGRPVMVIGYRFTNAPETQLIRRAILGIDLQEGFKTYRDPSEKEFDKIIISNNGLSDGVVAYRLEAEPTQLYPDGHPALAQGKPESEKRAPAAVSSEDTPKAKAPPDPSVDEDTGTIQPFYLKNEGAMNRR